MAMNAKNFMKNLEKNKMPLDNQGYDITQHILQKKLGEYFSNNKFFEIKHLEKENNAGELISFLPVKADLSDKGFDCRAYIVDAEDKPSKLIIRPFKTEPVKLGFSLRLYRYSMLQTATLPIEFAEEQQRIMYGQDLAFNLDAQLRPKSGLMRNNNILCFLGTLDNKWDNQCEALITNLSDQPYTVEFGQKICQLTIELSLAVLPQADKVNTEAELNGNTRGGFGSTGL